MKKILASLSLSSLFAPATAFAASADAVRDTASAGGVSAIWILANFSYAGMRAQDSSSHGWRVAAFIFGFPGTLVSFLAVPEGGGNVYGVAVPRKGRDNE